MLIALKICAYLGAVALIGMMQYIIEDMSCCTYAQEPGIEGNAIAQEPLGPTESNQVGWIIEDKDSLSVSTETNDPISGNSSLRVDIRQASSVNETIDSPWSGISTDFIPVSNASRHKFSLDVSAKNVNQLHSLIYYYDKSKYEIFNSSEYFIFGGIDGTFKDSFTSNFTAPKEAEYLKFQMWVRKSPEPSSFLLDNVKIERASAKGK